MKRWQFWVGILISVVFLWLALRSLKLSDVWSAFRQLQTYQAQVPALDSRAAVTRSAVPLAKQVAASMTRTSAATTRPRQTTKQPSPYIPPTRICCSPDRT